MSVMSFDAALPVIFMAVMGISMLIYVVSDGYDLGVGMLMHRATAAEKDMLVASIGPFWDANETWLVLGVGILLVAFPKAHGVVLQALYLPVAPLFFAFRAMVGIGVLMLATAWGGLWLYKRRGWNAASLPRPLLWVFAGMTFAGWLATVCGWYVTEIGRQPFIVHELIRTADIASKVAAPTIALTLTLYVLLYIALVIAYIGVLKYMAEKPEEVLDAEAKAHAQQPVGVGTSPVVGGGAAA